MIYISKLSDKYRTIHKQYQENNVTYIVEYYG